jgi:hypothetical protein
MRARGNGDQGHSRVWVKIASNAFPIESVRTYVPLIIATPSTVAIAVRPAPSCG